MGRYGVRNPATTVRNWLIATGFHVKQGGDWYALEDYGPV